MNYEFTGRKEFLSKLTFDSFNIIKEAKNYPPGFNPIIYHYYHWDSYSDEKKKSTLWTLRFLLKYYANRYDNIFTREHTFETFLDVLDSTVIDGDKETWAALTFCYITKNKESLDSIEKSAKKFNNDRGYHRRYFCMLFAHLIYHGYYSAARIFYIHKYLIDNLFNCISVDRSGIFCRMIRDEINEYEVFSIGELIEMSNDQMNLMKPVTLLDEFCERRIMIKDSCTKERDILFPGVNIQTYIPEPFRLILQEFGQLQDPLCRRTVEFFKRIMHVPLYDIIIRLEA